MRLFIRVRQALREDLRNFDFNENPSMRTIAKILRVRAREHSSKFCEHIEQRPNFASICYGEIGDKFGVGTGENLFRVGHGETEYCLCS